MIAGREHRGLYISLFVALILRVTVCCLLSDELTRDRDAYLPLARQLFHGAGFVSPDGRPTAFRPPLYPLQLASAFWVFPEPLAVAVVNLVWSLIAVWGTWSAARSLGLTTGAVPASLLVAFDPLLLWYSVQPMTEVMCAGLVACLMAFLVNRDRGTASGWRIGLVFGFLVLCRPTFWPLAGLALVATIVAISRNRSFGAARLLCWGAGTVVVVTPWVVRNFVVLGSPVLMTTHGGYTLLLGNNAVFQAEVVERGDGAEWSSESFERWQQALQGDLAQLGAGATELERDRWQSARAWEYLAGHPRAGLHAAWYRTRQLWSPVPRESSRNPWVRWCVLGWYLPVLLASAAGLVDRLVDLRWLPLLGLVVTVQLVHLLYWTNTRMRAPLVPVLSLYAVAGTVAVVRRPRPSPAEKDVS